MPPMVRREIPDQEMTDDVLGDDLEEETVQDLADSLDGDNHDPLRERG